MPKKVFWPATMVTMGLIFLASNLGLLPREFWHLWPLILIIVGLGGLLLSDRDDWGTVTSTKGATAAKPAKKSQLKTKSKARRR